MFRMDRAIRCSNSTSSRSAKQAYAPRWRTIRRSDSGRDSSSGQYSHQPLSAHVAGRFSKYAYSLARPSATVYETCTC